MSRIAALLLDRDPGNGVSAEIVRRVSDEASSQTHFVPHSSEKILDRVAFIFSVLAEVGRKQLVCAGEPVFPDNRHRVGFEQYQRRFWRIILHDLESCNISIVFLLDLWCSRSDASQRNDKRLAAVQKYG